MCTSIFFEDTKEHVSQVQALANKLGVTPADLFWHDGEPMPVDGGYEYCLCPIRIPATLRKFGYRGGWDKERDGMCFLAKPRVVNQQFRQDSDGL